MIEEVFEDLRYAPYLARQAAEIAVLSREEDLPLAKSFDFRAVAGLSNEMVERLEAARPETLGGVRRVRGVTPAALSAILLHSRR